MQSKVPQIRFKGFSREWEEKRLDNIADIIGGGTPSTNITEYWNGDIDWYSPTEIGYSNFVKGSQKKITRLGLEKSSAKIHPANKTILFTSRAGIGDMAILNKEGSTNQGFQSLILKDDYIPYFIYSAGHLIKKYALTYASGSTFLEISGKQLGNMNIKVPSLEEQEKIGNFFQKLDQLIDLKEKKYQKLQQFKKASLDKMFPKNGANTPEVRFKGFSGEWKLVKFKELANVKRGLTYKPSDISSLGIKVLRSSNIDEDNFIQNDDDVYVKEEAINIEFINEFDILITSANGSSRLVGKHAIVQNLSSKAVHGGFMLLATSESPFFLNASMGSHWYRKFINKFVSGGNGAIGNLSKSDLDEQEIYAPKKDEQTKIGNYFQKLDKQIDLQSKEIEKLKNIKKALLDKMFV